MELTANDALDLIQKSLQRGRENGETDLRSYIYLTQGIKAMVASGKPREEIIAAYADEDEET